MKLKPFAFAVLALMLGAARAEGLSPTEQKIVAEVKAHSAQGLQLLERSVNINSGTMNHDGVRAVGKLFGESSGRWALHALVRDMRCAPAI
jgi:glutamate carboxypeptidase